MADERLLFAYSALTYNLHRIHYDDRYAREVEHHPGLVVHGPLLALWCAEHARRRMPAAPTRVSYRLTSTAYVGHQVVIDSAEIDAGLAVQAISQGRTCVRMSVVASLTGSGRRAGPAAPRATGNEQKKVRWV